MEFPPAKPPKFSFPTKGFFQFSLFYFQEENVCFGYNIIDLMERTGFRFGLKSWKLFIHSGKASLKAVLLRDSNGKPSTPVAHATGLIENYESLEMPMGLIKYKDHVGNICGVLKICMLIS